MGIESQPASREQNGPGDSLPSAGQADDIPTSVRQLPTDATKVDGFPAGIVAQVSRRGWFEQNERIGKIIGEATRPVISEAAQRTSEVIESISISQSSARSYSSALATCPHSTAVDTIKNVAHPAASRTDLIKSLSGTIDSIASATAIRAAFSISSGLRVSDSVSSMLSKLVSDTLGIGLTSPVLSDLAAKIGVPATMALDAPAAADLSKKLTPQFSTQSLGVVRAQSTQQLTNISGIANLIATDGLMGSWRQTLLAEATARSLVGTIKIPEGETRLLREIVGINAATTRVLAQLASKNRSTMLPPALNTNVTKELRKHLSGLSVAPSVDELTFATHASRAVAGMTTADLIVSVGEIDDDSRKLVEVEVVEPWLTEPRNARQELLNSLREIDPQIPELLRAAWAQVGLNGPAAVAMASHAAVEVLDRTLRALAPNDAVLAEHEAGRLPSNSVYVKDDNVAPTRAGRVAYAVQRCHPGQTKLVGVQTKALAASVTNLQDFFQAGKHTSAGSVGLVRMHLVAVESVLTQLLYRETG